MANVRVSDELESLLGPRVAKAFRALELAVGQEKQPEPEAVAYMLRRVASWGPPDMAIRVFGALNKGSAHKEQAGRQARSKPTDTFVPVAAYAERGRKPVDQYGSDFLSALSNGPLTRDEAAGLLGIGTSTVSLMVHALAQDRQIEVRKRLRVGRRPVDEYCLPAAAVPAQKPDSVKTELVAPETHEQWQAWVWQKCRGHKDPLAFSQLTRNAMLVFGQAPDWTQVFDNVRESPASENPAGRPFRVDFDEQFVG